MIDKKELKKLYDEYISGSLKVYNQLWFLIINFSNYMIVAWCKKLCITLNDEELLDLSIESAIKVMDKVSKKHEIKDFSGLIYYTTSNVLRDRKNKLARSNKIISLEDYLKNEGKYQNDSEEM